MECETEERTKCNWESEYIIGTLPRTEGLDPRWEGRREMMNSTFDLLHLRSLWCIKVKRTNRP